MPTIRKITDWQGIYRNVPAIVWKKGLQVVRESKKPEQNLRWDLRNSFLRYYDKIGLLVPEYRKDDMEELRLIPLEYLYSLNSGILANA